MNAPTVVTLKFPQFGKEPALDPNEVPPDFVREPVIGSRETIDPDNSDNRANCHSSTTANGSEFPSADADDSKHQ